MLSASHVVEVPRRSSGTVLGVVGLDRESPYLLLEIIPQVKQNLKKKKKCAGGRYGQSPPPVDGQVIPETAPRWGADMGPR